MALKEISYTTKPEILPKIVARLLLEELYMTYSDGSRRKHMRQEAAGTVCPKHRRDWYLRSKGMPTGF